MASELKPPYYVVNFSGGKDSTAMLLRLLELDMTVDEIIFCDTTAEFPQMYEHVDRVEKYIGRPITRLRREHSWEYMLLHHVKKNGTVGYSFPDFRNRWCTAYFKRDHIKSYLKDIRKTHTVIHYVGIAADEPKRVRGESYPLVEWGWTEADCLQYCYDRGFDWGGLYKVFNRVSCWCCPLKSLKELQALRENFPELWAKLEQWQTQTWRSFRSDYSVLELEAKFGQEDGKVGRFQQMDLFAGRTAV